MGYQTDRSPAAVYGAHGGMMTENQEKYGNQSDIHYEQGREHFENAFALIKQAENQIVLARAALYAMYQQVNHGVSTQNGDTRAD